MNQPTRPFKKIEHSSSLEFNFDDIEFLSIKVKSSGSVEVTLKREHCKSVTIPIGRFMKKMEEIFNE